MTGQFPLYAVPILVGAFISGGLAAYSWRQRKTLGARPLALLTAAAAVWSLAYFFELTSENLDLAKLWLKVEYIGIVVVPAAWLILSMEYCGYIKLLTSGRGFLLFGLPAVTVGLVWTNDIHNLIWGEVGQIFVNGFYLLDVRYGIWFWIHTGYSYVLLLVGAYLMLRKVLNSQYLYQYQIISLSVAALTPVLGNLMYIFGWNPFSPLDLTSFAILISQVAFGLGIFRFRLLDIIPIARDQVIENMSDGIIVIDPKSRVVDVNQAAVTILGLEITEILGNPIGDVLGKWTRGQVQKIDLSIPQQDVRISGKSGSKWFSVKVAKLGGNLIGQKGRVIVLHDISQRKQMALGLEDQQQFLLKLNEITQVAISSTQFIPMLQGLADNMGGLFNADGCYITQWDEKSKRTIPLAASGEMRENYREMAPAQKVRTITESVIQEGRPLAIEDLYNTPYLSPEIVRQFPSKSMLAIPLIADQRGFGAVLIGYNTPHTFSGKEISRAEMVSRQIALAVSRMISLELAEKRAEESESLRKATAIVASSLGQKATIDRILAQLELLVSFDAAYAQLHKGIILEVVGGRGRKVTERAMQLRFPLSGGGLSPRVFRSKEPLIIGNIQEGDQDTIQPFPEWVTSWMGVPLIIGKKVIGILALESSEEGHFNEDSLRLVATFANNVAIAVQNAQLMEELQTLAQVDDLTGLYNRRQLFKIGNLELQRTRRYGHPFSVIMIDIDHFKKINDTYGHVIGDEVLRFLANSCRPIIREVDVMARYGGEEFVILLPETTQETAFQLAERLRNFAHDNPVKTKAGIVNFTVSAGVAQFILKMPDLAALIDRADTALYRAKENGRNQVFCYGSKSGLPDK